MVTAPFRAKALPHGIIALVFPGRQHRPGWRAPKARPSTVEQTRVKFSSRAPKRQRRSRNTFDNMWALGGEFIRDLHNYPTLRRRPVDQCPFEDDRIRRAAPVSR